MKVLIHLSALTRATFSKEIEVPNGTTDEELEAKVDEIYTDTDGDLFSEDNEFWERGDCYFNKVKD